MMASYFKQPDTEFKIPAVPTRYRRPTYNSTQTMCTNTCYKDNTVDELEERLGVLKNLYPPEDHIWKEMINTVNNLCYEKIREQIFQPNSQAQSVYNGTTECQSLSSQYGRSRETHTTGLPSNKLQSQLQVFQPNSQAQAMQYNGTTEYQSLSSQHGRCRETYTTGLQSNKLQGQSQISQPNTRAQSVYNGTTECESVSSQHGQSRKTRTAGVPSNKLQSRLQNSQLNSQAQSVNVSSQAGRSRKTRTTALPSNELQSQLQVSEPNSQAAQSVSDETNVSESETSHCDESRETRTTALPSNKLQVLPSEDENDSLCAFFQRKRRPIKKCTAITTKSTGAAAKPKLSANISISLKRVDLADHIPARKSNSSKIRKRKLTPLRQTSRAKRHSSDNDSDVSKPVAVPKTRPSRRASASTTKHTNASTAKRTNASVAKRSNASVTKRATAPTAKRKTTATVKTSPAKPKPAKKPAAKQPTPMVQEQEPSPVCGFEQIDDGSMFGDVSSIAGDVSPIVSNTMIRNVTKHSKENGNEMPSHFFSPFANVRSTSGFSAISTPMSKSTAKNVLGKRLKKPSVVAELKDELKPRKKKATASKTEAQPSYQVDSVTTESECEASDFSDD